MLLCHQHNSFDMDSQVENEMMIPVGLVGILNSGKCPISTLFLDAFLSIKSCQTESMTNGPKVNQEQNRQA